MLDKPTACRVGALGIYTVSPGLYVYVGSAWGPGGLAARLNRHLRGHGKQRWHIDYLRQITHPMGIWLAPDARLECTWAQALHQLPQARTPIPGFGASDCRCTAHLFAIDDLTADSIVLPGNPIYITV